MIELSKPEERATYPLVHCTVLRTLERQPISHPDRFEKSRLVRLRSDSKFYNLDPRTTGLGQIIQIKPEEPGWVWVRFPGEFVNRFRIGDPDLDGGACDLDLDALENFRFVIVSYGNQLVEFPLNGLMAEPGDTVKIDPKAGRIIATEKAIPSGNIAFIFRIVNETFVEVDYQGNRRTVFAGKFSGKLESNGRVVLDSTGTVIIENYGLEDDSFAVSESDIKITLDDVYGQEKAVLLFKEILDESLTTDELAAAYKVPDPKGVLLWGPPGCGKTILGKGAYNSLITLCKKKGVPAGQGFMYISGAQILDKYVGVAEASIRHIFARARKFQEKYGIPCIIFIDEADAIGAKRDSGISSDVLRTIVPTLLAEMDGIRASKAIVVLATNKPEILDEAFIREERIDVKIEVKRPNRDAARRIFASNLKGNAIHKDLTADDLVNFFDNMFFSDKLPIFEISVDRGEGKTETMYFGLKDIISGALVASIAKNSARIAKRRDRDLGGTPTGISLADVENAIMTAHEQSFATDHREALGDFTKDFQDHISGLHKLKQVRG